MLDVHAGKHHDVVPVGGRAAEDGEHEVVFVDRHVRFFEADEWAEVGCHSRTVAGKVRSDTIRNQAVPL